MRNANKSSKIAYTAIVPGAAAVSLPPPGAMLQAAVNH